MGMFDTFVHDVTCPHCGRVVPKFQGKDGPCQLNIYYFGDELDLSEWMIATTKDLIFEVHEFCGSKEETIPEWHWLDGIGVVHEGRWIATIITSVSSVGTGSSGDLWKIRSD